MNKKNNMGCLVAAAAGGIIVVGLAIGGITILSSRSTIINLEQSIKTQYTYNKSNYDSMVKSAKEMVQVTDMYADDFEKIYTDLISGRNQDTNLLFKVVHESNPNLDSSVYTTLQRELSANRKTFDNNQAKVIDRIGEYNRYVERKFITSAILNKQPKDPNEFIVTSDSTKEAFDKGEADEIQLRKDKE